VILAKHDFGIMQNAPLVNERFDIYEPLKYNCIAVDDDLIGSTMVKLQNVDSYWHTLQRTEKGIDYCGITLIPPKSMETFISICRLKTKWNLHF
jgi:hypothetical protein